MTKQQLKDLIKEVLSEAEGFRIKPQPKSPLEGAVVSYVDNDGHYHADIILKTKEGREVKGRFEYHRGQFAFESATNEMYSDTSYKTEKGYDAAKKRVQSLKDELKHIQDLKNKSDYNDTNDPQARNYHNRRLKEIPKEISAIRQKILGLRENVGGIQGYIFGPMDAARSWISQHQAPKTKNGRQVYVVSAAAFQQAFPNMKPQPIDTKKISPHMDYFFIDGEGDLMPISQANIGSGLD